MLSRFDEYLIHQTPEPLAHPVSMDRIGNAPVARDDVPVEAVDQLLVWPVGRMGRVLLGDDQPGATLGTGRVVGRVLLGRQPVLCVVGQVRAEDDAVAHRHRPQLQR